MSPKPISKLWLPYDSLMTIYEGVSEVRLYQNDVTGALYVGKRIDTLGLEESVGVREATLLQRIDHPNLVRVFDVAEVTGAPAPMRQIEMTMPYFERGSLCDALLVGETFSVGAACSHVTAALLGLAELHEVHRIIHRDVKSPNVFLSDDESLLKVGDLSVAVPRDRDGQAEAFQEAALCSPPETFSAERIGTEVDIYGMGLVFFEMVNGRLPYELYPRATCEERIQRGLRAIRDADLKFAPHIPRGVRRIINKAIARRPEDRFSSASAMNDAISRLSIIDWALVDSSPDRYLWEGTDVRRKGRSLRVTASLSKRGLWVFKGEQRLNSWRRVLPDQVMDSAHGKTADSFFDQISTLS